MTAEVRALPPETASPPAAAPASVGYAGIVTRTAGYIVDLVVVAVSFTVGVALTQFVVILVVGEATRLTDAVRALAASAYTAYLVAYFAVPVALFGRTPGQALLGLRVRCSDGRPVGAVRAVVRALVLPLLTTATLGLSALGILLGRRRRALHDVIAGTVVVYDAPEPARALLHVEHL